MRSYVVVLGLSALVAGISLLGIVQQQVLRPRPLAGAVLVLDERPADFNKQFSLGVASAFESDMTLITVTDPMISVGSASIEPVADGLSIEGVMQLLEQARPEAIIREIRIKREQGMTIYEIDFSDNWRLKMNAANGQMLSLEPSSSKSPPPAHRLQGYMAPTTLLGAVAVAQARHPRSTLKDAKLEIRDGVLVYKVKFDGGIDVFVDATTGEHLFSSCRRDVMTPAAFPSHQKSP